MAELFLVIAFSEARAVNLYSTVPSGCSFLLTPVGMCSLSFEPVHITQKNCIIMRVIRIETKSVLVFINIACPCIELFPTLDIPGKRGKEKFSLI